MFPRVSLYIDGKKLESRNRHFWSQNEKQILFIPPRRIFIFLVIGYTILQVRERDRPWNNNNDKKKQGQMARDEVRRSTRWKHEVIYNSSGVARD